jgi:hypothetical protein
MACAGRRVDLLLVEFLLEGSGGGWWSFGVVVGEGAGEVRGEKEGSYVPPFASTFTCLAPLHRSGR